MWSLRAAVIDYMWLNGRFVLQFVRDKVKKTRMLHKEWTELRLTHVVTCAGFQLVNRKDFRRIQSVKKTLFEHFHRQLVAQWHRVQEGFFPFYFKAMWVFKRFIFFGSCCIFQTLHQTYSTGPDCYLVPDVKLRKTVVHFLCFVTFHYLESDCLL